MGDGRQATLTSKQFLRQVSVKNLHLYIMKYKREEIHWDDAYHLTDSWLSSEQIAEKYDEGAFKVVNIGWVIYEDKRYVILSSKRDVRWGDWGFVMMIPKGMITKRKKLK